MRGGRIWAVGGFVAGAVLILFGVVALYLGVTSYQLVHDELAQEKIVGGQDMSPEGIAPGIEEAGLSRTSRRPTATSSTKRSTQARRRAASPPTCASMRSRRPAA